MTTSDSLEKETTFTPGPWSIQDERSLCDEIWIGAEHPEVGFVSHASVRSGCGETDELGSLEANARLIAAAPELYEALIIAREQLEICELALTGETYNSPIINSALAKASGKDRSHDRKHGDQ